MSEHTSPPPDDAAPPRGGLGGDALEPGVRTTRLLERALRERWPVPTSLRGRVVERLAATIDDPGTSPREATAAALALLQASRTNLSAIDTALRAKSQEELEGRIAALETAAGKHKGERFS